MLAINVARPIAQKKARLDVNESKTASDLAVISGWGPWFGSMVTKGGCARLIHLK